MFKGIMFQGKYMRVCDVAPYRRLVILTGMVITSMVIFLALMSNTIPNSFMVSLP
jgi:hypothetical protein